MRQAVSDGRDMFRVVVASYGRARNPDYVPGSGIRYWILTDQVHHAEYGPYPRIGTAKAVLTRETVDTAGDGGLKWGVVGGWIEQAETTWRKVDLGGGS